MKLEPENTISEAASGNSESITATIQIGNSDDRLKQSEWSEFIVETEVVLRNLGADIHFSGSSPCEAKWQNHAFVANMESSKIRWLIGYLIILCKKYRQDSIALTTGKTSMF